MKEDCYESARRAGIAAYEADRPREAYERLTAAWELSRAGADADFADRAYCNLAMVAFEIGEEGARPWLRELREIKNRSRTPAIAFLACYQLARAYEHLRDARKGTFYGRMALELAHGLADPFYRWASHTILGNQLTMDSDFQGAAREYRTAVAALPKRWRWRHLNAWINLAFCETMLGRPHVALPLLRRCLAVAAGQGLRRLETEVHLDLCLAHLELERADEALRHGLAGLRGSRRSGRPGVLKNALFLVGEALVQAGRPGRAVRYHEELQQRFYPEQPLIVDLLSAVDVRQMVNLRA